MTTRIRARRARADPSGPPPSFRIRTDRARFVVEVTIDPVLFNGALWNRRTAANFHMSAEIQARGRRTRYTLDPGVWRALKRFPYLYYRVRAFDGTLAAARRLEVSVADHDFWRAPSIYIVPTSFRFPPVRRRLSGNLTWLRVEGNRVVNEAGDTVVLRGVNRSGMEYSDRNRLDPTGRRRPTSRQVAGITRNEIREIVNHWGANVIRLPINQEWVLTRADYLSNLDTIIRWAAAEGAYTLLDLQWFDTHREFGRLSSGRPNRVPPMPEENSIRMWRHLAARYRFEPAVLYGIFNEPHKPLASDTSFLFTRPNTELGWLRMWHSWVRRIEAAIHRENKRALIFVSGWDWALNLRHFPVSLPGGRTLPNAVYSTHVYFHTTPGRSTATTADFDFWFGFNRLRSIHPIFVGEWGGKTANVAWGNMLEGYLRDLHYRDWIWQGLAGWTAWSWADQPLLVERPVATRTTSTGTTLRWRTFRMVAGHNQPTDFGGLVRQALRTPVILASGDAAYANALDKLAVDAGLDAKALTELKKWAKARGVPIAHLLLVARNPMYQHHEKLEAMKIYAIAYDATYNDKLSLQRAGLFHQPFLPALRGGKFLIDLSKDIGSSAARYSHEKAKRYEKNTLYLTESGIDIQSIYQRGVVIHEAQHVIQDAMKQTGSRFDFERDAHEAGTEYLARESGAMKKAVEGFFLNFTVFNDLWKGNLYPGAGLLELPDMDRLVVLFLDAARDNLESGRGGQNGPALFGATNANELEVVIAAAHPKWGASFEDIYLDVQTIGYTPEAREAVRHGFEELYTKKGLFP